MKPTVERVREMFDYDPLNGIVRWKKLPAKGKSKLGGFLTLNEEAGSLKKSMGRWQISLDSGQYMRAVIAFVIVEGHWPDQDVEHKDRNPLNDRWENLREGTRSLNHANRSNIPHSSPYKGVTFCSQTKKWKATIGINYTKKTLGRFDTPEEARDAYMRAARELFGEFATEG